MMDRDRGSRSLPAPRSIKMPILRAQVLENEPRRWAVADLICVAFDDPTTADRALTVLTALQ